MSTHLENIAIGASYYQNHHQSQWEDGSAAARRRLRSLNFAAAVVRFALVTQWNLWWPSWWTTVTPIKRALHCLMDHPCWKEISGRKLWFPRSLVSHRGVLFIANLVQEKETAKPYKAWQSTGSYRSMAKENSCHWSCHSTYYFNAFVITYSEICFLFLSLSFWIDKKMQG